MDPTYFSSYIRKKLQLFLFDYKIVQTAFKFNYYTYLKQNQFITGF